MGNNLKHKGSVEENFQKFLAMLQPKNAEPLSESIVNTLKDAYYASASSTHDLFVKSIKEQNYIEVAKDVLLEVELHFRDRIQEAHSHRATANKV